MADPSPFLRKALKERDELARKLEANPEYRRLRALERLIAAYQDEPGTPVVAPKPPSQFSLVGEPEPEASAPRRVEIVAAAAAEEIEKRKAPIPTQEMLGLLTARGIEIGGRDPRNNLAAMLSNSKRFLSRRGLGWYLPTTPM